MKILYNQDSTEQDYAASGVFKRKSDAGDLHMFFSPYRMPTGLTDEQVRTCLKLYKRKSSIQERLKDEFQKRLYARFKAELEDDFLVLEKKRENLSLIFGEAAMSMTPDEIADLVSNARLVEYNPLPVPKELLTDPMTEEGFNLGISILVSQMDSLEKK